MAIADAGHRGSLPLTKKATTVCSERGGAVELVTSVAVDASGPARHPAAALAGGSRGRWNSRHAIGADDEHVSPCQRRRNGTLTRVARRPRSTPRSCALRRQNSRASVRRRYTSRRQEFEGCLAGAVDGCSPRIEASGERDIGVGGRRADIPRRHDESSQTARGRGFRSTASFSKTDGPLHDARKTAIKSFAVSVNSPSGIPSNRKLPSGRAVACRSVL